MAIPQLILHEDPISGHCYKIRLVASLLGLPIERRQYSILKQETRTSYFQEYINSYGRIPVLQIGADVKTARFLPESNAAVAYLTELSTSSLKLIPTDAFERAEMLRWMFFEQAHIDPSIATLRYWKKYIGLENLSPEKQAQLEGIATSGTQVLESMEAHLNGSSGKGAGSRQMKDWFVAGDVSLADLVLYAYIHVAREGGWDMEKYPSLLKWIDRVQGLDGWVKM